MKPSPVHSLTSQPHQPRSIIALEQAHLQRFIDHPDLGWLDYLLIAVTAPGPALLPLPTISDAQHITAQLMGQHSTLLQMGAEELTTLLQTTPQDLLKATRMALILHDWLYEQAIPDIISEWDIPYDKLRTLITRTRRLIETMVTMATDHDTSPTLATYRLQTLAKMLHGFSSQQTSLLTLPNTPLWVLRKLRAAHITTLKMLADAPFQRLEALFNPVIADKLRTMARHLLAEHPPTYFTARAYHEPLPTIQETTPLLSIFGMVA